MFARNYIKKHQLQHQLSVKIDERLKIIVVIPCFNEPEILSTLNSLDKCHPISSLVEVIIVINHSEDECQTLKNQNQFTLEEIETWKRDKKDAFISFHAIGPVALKRKWAGVGLARKLGMDEAILRFNAICQPNGIVVSLDADTLVRPNYFTAIETYFKNHPQSVGATINFEHQKEGLPEKQKAGIELYEQYMDYYKKAVSYTGYPYAMFTVGSAFAVTADAYVKRGGMNRRQAGEDFYFLQNLAHIGKVGAINTTMVFPSARTSDRVPFGTGPILQKWLDGKEELTRTYNFAAFKAIRTLFDNIEQFYKTDNIGYDQLISKFPDSLQTFLNETDFYKEIVDLNGNCSSLSVFKKRFSHRFNAFQILKFLNYSHQKYYQKADLQQQIELLNKEN